MNIKTLTLFLHLCDSKNFSQTAATLHISPSALSRQIQKLEQDIGHSLFIRDNRRVALTPTGYQLKPIAQRMVEEWQGFQQSINRHEDELQGEIRLFCSVTASYSHLPELLDAVRQKYPYIEFNILTGDPALAISKVLNDEVDIAISAMPDPLPSRVEFCTISELPLSFIGPSELNGFVEEVQKSQPDWSQIPFILPQTGTARTRANEWFKKMGIKPNIYAQISGNEALVSMVALGCGIGLVPDVVLNNSPVRDKVQRLPITPIKPFKLGVCCQRSQLHNPLVHALWQVVTKHSSLVT